MPLPAGEWRLLRYTISAADSRPGNETLVAAMGTTDCTPVAVTAGTTAKFPFGPPYMPVVHVVPSRSRRAAQNKEVRLSMNLVGSAGEECFSLLVGGNRPEAPRFVVATKDGQIVERGVFRYG